MRDVAKNRFEFGKIDFAFIGRTKVRSGGLYGAFNLTG
jgi:hypothetical protein